jgi:hypothetical protein
MARISIHAADTEQLRQFARLQNLAVSPNPNTSREKILSVIEQAGFSEIDVPDEAMPAATEPAPAPQAKQTGAPSDHTGTPYVEVLIEREDSVGGDRPVFLSVNGRGLLVARGKPQRIKYPYYEALRNAVKTVFDNTPETGETLSRDVPAYNWRVLRMPEQAQIDAWHAKEAETAEQAEKETRARIERKRARADAAA